MIFPELISKIPKAEIHIHLEAVASIRTLLELNRKYRVLALDSEEDFNKYIFVDSLTEMIANFFDLQKLFREPDDYKLLKKDILTYMDENNITYIEGFISPSMVKKLGYISVIDFFEIWDEMIGNIHEDKKKRIRLIVDLSRSFGPENAMENLNAVKNHLKNYSKSSIIGLGLGGLEIGNPAADYASIFKKAKDTGLHLVAHAGEEVGPESIVEALDLCFAERIGHGTSAIYDKKVMDILKNRNIALEICVTSNILTKKYASNYADHPIGKFVEHGIPVTINTDDPTLFSVNLNHEIERVHTRCGLDKKTIFSLLRNNIDYSFISDEKKRDFWDASVLELIKNNQD